MQREITLAGIDHKEMPKNSGSCISHALFKTRRPEVSHQQCALQALEEEGRELTSICARPGQHHLQWGPPAVGPEPYQLPLLRLEEERVKPTPAPPKPAATPSLWTESKRMFGAENKHIAAPRPWKRHDWACNHFNFFCQLTQFLMPEKLFIFVRDSYWPVSGVYLVPIPLKYFRTET